MGCIGWTALEDLRRTPGLASLMISPSKGRAYHLVASGGSISLAGHSAVLLPGNLKACHQQIKTLHRQLIQARERIICLESEVAKLRPDAEHREIREKGRRSARKRWAAEK
jgi:hypothetical protein